MLQSDAMGLERRRYTTVDRAADWIVGVAWDDSSIETTHWFEAQVAVRNEATGTVMDLPAEIARYRIGEIEHSLREIIAIDWNGDSEAALAHMRETIFRRVHSFIERGH